MVLVIWIWRATTSLRTKHVETYQWGAAALTALLAVTSFLADAAGLPDLLVDGLTTLSFIPCAIGIACFAQQTVRNLLGIWRG